MSMIHGTDGERNRRGPQSKLSLRTKATIWQTSATMDEVVEKLQSCCTVYASKAPEDVEASIYQWARSVRGGSPNKAGEQTHEPLPLKYFADGRCGRTSSKSSEIQELMRDDDFMSLFSNNS